MTIQQKKISTIIVFVALTFNLYGQSNDTVFVYADSLEKGRISLGDIWRYHAGDDSAWADPGLNILSWDSLNTRLDKEQIDSDIWTGIGWFRKILVVDSALLGNLVALRIEHFGASQIFLNGREIHSYGNVSAEPDSEIVRKPSMIPLAVELDTVRVHHIAVRYSNHTAVERPDWYKRWFKRAGFAIYISELNESIIDTVEDGKLNFTVNIGIAGLFLALGILYIFLFLFYARRKENLFYALFTFSISVIFMTSMFTRLSVSGLTFYYVVMATSAFAIGYIFISYLGFLYSIFYQKLPKLFWGLLALVVLISSSIFIYVPQEWINYPLFIFILLATLEGLRVIIVAIKKKKENAWVIGIGVILFVSFIVMLFVLAIFEGNLDNIYGILIFLTGILSLPISMSIYLARDIALTNKKLEHQIVTIKNLTEKQIEQERHNAKLKLDAELAEAEYARKTKELEEARQLQLSMLPTELPVTSNLDIAVYMKTATEVGGDYYDFHVGPDGTLTIVIGDATGHGMKAGTIVTASKSLFSTHASNSDILYTFHEMTRCLKQLKMHLMFMCMTIMKIKNEQLTLSSAGMPPTYIYRAGSRKVEEVLAKGMPLGTFDNFPYKIKTTSLDKGDIILMLSDGLPELFNSNGEMFGYERVIDLLENSDGKSAANVVDELKDAETNWLDNGDPQDDITFVVIKMK